MMAIQRPSHRVRKLPFIYGAVQVQPKEQSCDFAAVIGCQDKSSLLSESATGCGHDERPYT